MSDLPIIDPKVITAAAEAGAQAASSMTYPHGSTVMVLVDRCKSHHSMTTFDRDRRAREAFARAAIEVYQIWARPPLKDRPNASSTDARTHAHTIVTRLHLAGLTTMEAVKAATDSVEEYLNVCFYAPDRADTPGIALKMEQLTQDLMKAMQERDEAKVRELVAEKSAGWVKFSDRKPTTEDADANDNVCCMGVDGVMWVQSIRHSNGFDECMWRPTNNPVPIPLFVRWKRSLTEEDIADFDSEELEWAWKSINKFIAENPS
jgi:hypothetical protein